MDFDKMQIPQFGLSAPLDETVKNAALFIGVGVVAGIAAAAINNIAIRNTIAGLNYELGEHFIEEAKKHNPQ